MVPRIPPGAARPSVLRPAEARGAGTLGGVRIDPHTHSLASDGTDTPAELMARAAAVGLDVVGLTDHDTVRGWQEAEEAVAATGVALVRGTEVSCSVDGIAVHVLSLLHDPGDIALAELLESARTARLRRAQAMVEGLAADFPITWESVAAQAGDLSTVGRPHMADALVAAGVFPDRDHAFASVLHSSGPYYIHLEVPHPRDVVGAIRAAGGVPVMAHPFAARRGKVVSDAVVEDLAAHGLAALEADHRDHTGADRAHARALARRLGLLVTGASDYHGRGKPNQLGENLTAQEVFDEIVAHGTLGVVWP